MRFLGMTIGCFALLLVGCFFFGDHTANAQGQGGKGLDKAMQKVPPQAQSKLEEAAQKGQGQQKANMHKKSGKGKGKGKGQS